ncbi:MAG: DoxX family protein [Acidobacteriia bacterium]|nr:DoxX family protein [Terriglobia bacterium]
MKKKNRIAYWVATVFVASIMTVSGGLAITHAAPMMKALAHLGYPPYFGNLLGVGKLAGVVVLLLPGVAKLKEWAYAGFAITVISAAYSHFCSGDGLMALDPLVTLAALVVSYRLRPENRRSAAGERPRHEKPDREREFASAS